MKFKEIFLFLLLLNIAISIVSMLSIYHIGTDVDDEFTAENYETFNVETFVGTQLFTLAGSAIAISAATYYFGRVAADSAAVYGVFGGVILTTFLSATSILSKIIMITPDSFKLGVAIPIAVFLAISGLVFIFSFMQIVKGGWASFE